MADLGQKINAGPRPQYKENKSNMLDALRKSAATWVAKIFIGILVLSFAVWGIADIFGGYGQQTVASVGDIEISEADYQRAYQDELRLMTATLRRQVSPQMARNLGIDGRVMTRLVAGAALDSQATKLGLGISEDALAELIRNDDQFKGADGKFSRLALDQALRNAGMSEQGYIYDRRKGAVRGQITNIFAEAPTSSKTMLEAWNKYWNATREAEFFVLTEKNIDPIKPADDTTLRTYYNDNKREFIAPEFREIDVLIVDPELIKKSIDIKDADVKSNYDANISRYTVPEKRAIEQIPFPDQRAAEEALKKIKAGTKFEAIAKDRGIDTKDLSLGTVAKDELFDKTIGEAAFALKKDEVSAPVKGKLSTVLIRVTDIVPGLTRTFEEMKDKIRDEMQKAQSADKILDLYDIIEDARAGGATLKEIADKNQLKHLITTVDDKGQDKHGRLIQAIASRSGVLTGAFQSDVDVENDAVELYAGAYAWFVVNKVIPSRTLSYDEAKAKVEASWKKNELRKELLDKAKELVKKGNDGEKIADLAKSVKAELKKPYSFRRSANLKGFPRSAVEQAFTMEIGKFASAAQEGGQGRVIFKLNKVNPPEELLGDNKQKFEDQISGDLVDDLLAQYLAGLQKDLGLNVNQQVVERLRGTGGRY